MDFGKINTSTITTPASAMSMDKPIYFGGTAGTSGTSGAIRGGTTGFVEFKNTTNDWKELNANYNAGVYTTPSVSVSATGGVLTIGEGVFNLHADPYGGDVVKTYTISGGTLTIPDSGSTSYVYADYNDGSPIYAYTSDESTLTGTTNMPFLTCYRAGDDVDLVEWGESAKALAIKLSSKSLRAERYQRETGLTLGETTGKKITISDGYVWFGSTRQYKSSFTTGASGCTLREWVYDGSEWTPTVVDAYDTANYQGPTGKVDLGNNEYGVIWVYRKMSTTDPLGVVAGYVFGTEAYASLAAAQAAKIPSNLPPIFSSLGLLVGRMCFGSDDASSTIDSAFETSYSAAAASDHANLSNIQGGGAGEHYHETLDEYEHSQSLPYTAIYNQLYNTTFERWTNSGLTQGATSGRQTAFNVTNILTDTDGSSYAGWTGASCTIADGGANLLVTANDTGGTQVATYTLSGLTVGKRYKFAATIANGTGTLAYGCKMSVTQNGGNHIRSTRTHSAGTYSILWEAIGATDKISFTFKMSNTQNMAISSVYVDEVHHGCVDADTYAADDHSKTTTLDCFREWNVDSANTYGYGKFLLKLIKGADTAEYYNFDTINTNYRDFQTKKVAFGCYVYSVTATDNIKLSIHDGQSEIAVSTSHCGADAITWMEVTGTVAANATKVQARILCDGNTNDIAYISHPVLMIGTKIGAGNYRVGPSLTLPCAQFNSTTSQTTSSTSIDFPIAFENQDSIIGMRHSTTIENSKLYMTTAGTYLFAISAIADSNAVAKRLNIWASVDGANYPNSNTIVQMPSANTETIIAVTFIVTLTENQYVELMMYGDDTSNRIVANTASSGPPARPASPSIIVTVNKIA